MTKNHLKEIRWKQRFANFEKAYTRFNKAIACDTANDEILRAGLIQTFEFLFELAWKTMKDKLESEGFVLKNPRETIQQALQSHYITQGELWIKAMDTRNELSHTYSESMNIGAEKEIRDHYAHLFMEFYEYLKKSL